MAKTVVMDEEEFQQLLKEIDNFTRAIIELKEHRWDPEEVEGRCGRILGRLHRMRKLVTFLT